MATASVADSWPAILSGVVTLFTVAVGWFAYKFKPPDRAKPGDDVAVVSATFADRKVIQMLTSAIEANNIELVELNGHMRADAQRRHDEAVVRQALKERGILE